MSAPLRLSPLEVVSLAPADAFTRERYIDPPGCADCPEGEYCDSCVSAAEYDLAVRDGLVDPREEGR